MPSMNWVVTVAVAFTLGGLAVALRRTARETEIAALFRPKCDYCHDQGVHATNEVRPRALFCNFCAKGVELEQLSRPFVIGERGPEVLHLHRGAEIIPVRRPPGGDAA